MFASVLTFVNSAAGADYIRTTIKESMRDDAHRHALPRGK